MLLFRASLAVLLALIAGAWMSSRFGRRLQELSKGATAFDEGDFRHRIPETGDDEFTQLAVAMNEMAERVSKQIGGLEEDAGRRRQFLADMAHELRGPVTTIRTMAGAMEDGLAEDPERRNRAVGSMVRASDRLLGLVNDLLQLAKLDLKELPIQPRNIDLWELVSAAVESHSASAGRAGIALDPIEPGPKVNAFADPDRLTQVLDNLLDNALDHAGEGSRVTVSVEGGEVAKIVVADNGRGIPAKDLPYVFEPFYRVDPVRSPEEGHSGLGLRISRGLVEAQGGELTLTSREGAGTTVTITLPTRP
jgi:signal transduction histidine kinase